MALDIGLDIITFLTAIGVSTFAMVSGGEGAIIFTPFFIAIGLSPQQAIATVFVTQLFGKTSGTIGYHAKKCLIQWKLVGILLLFGLPLVIAGAYLTHFLNSPFLQFLFGAMAISLAAVMASSLRKNDGNRDSVENKELLKWSFVPAAAGFLTGLFSIGCGTINLILLERVLKLKIVKAAATVVAVMAFTALAGSIVHVYYGVRWDILPFTVGGVLIGGQIGPRLANWLDSKNKSYLIKILFVALTTIVGIIMMASSGIL
jgi:uncharacterized protein